MITELDYESDSEEEDDELDRSGKQLRKRKIDSEAIEVEDDTGPSGTSQKRQKLESSEVEETANTSLSLRHLKKMYAAKVEKATEVVSRDGDGILSNEDFQRIRDLQVTRAGQELQISTWLIVPRVVLCSDRFLFVCSFQEFTSVAEIVSPNLHAVISGVEVEGRGHSVKF